jgi:hypothetical protein
MTFREHLKNYFGGFGAAVIIGLGATGIGLQFSGCGSSLAESQRAITRVLEDIGYEHEGRRLDDCQRQYKIANDVCDSSDAGLKVRQCKTDYAAAVQNLELKARQNITMQEGSLVDTRITYLECIKDVITPYNLCRDAAEIENYQCRRGRTDQKQ